MIWIGTSGYNYPEWKGSFYPADLPAAKMLPYYAARFPTVEINYTFYRMPNEKLVGGLGGADAVAVQADAEGAAADHARQPAEELRRAASRVLPGRRHARRQARRAAVSAAAEPEEGPARSSTRSSPSCRRRCRAAFEFRHPSWLDDEVFERLASAEPRAVRRRQREAVHAGAGHRRLRLLPPARRRLHARRHRALGRHDRARDRRVPGRVRLLQARGGREGAGVRAAADGAPRRRCSATRVAIDRSPGVATNSTIWFSAQ